MNGPTGFVIGSLADLASSGSGLLKQLYKELKEGIKATRALHNKNAYNERMEEVIKNLFTKEDPSDPFFKFVAREAYKINPEDPGQVYTDVFLTNQGIPIMLAKQQQLALQRGLAGLAGLTAGGIPTYAYHAAKEEEKRPMKGGVLYVAK